MNADDVKEGGLYRVPRFALLALPAATVRVVRRETPETFVVQYGPLDPGAIVTEVGGIAAADMTPVVVLG